jgi:hypothetical protein
VYSFHDLSRPYVEDMMKPPLNACPSHTRAVKDAGERTPCAILHKVVEEVLIAVLVARCCEVFFRHHIIVGMVSLPGKLLALLRNSGFLLALLKMSDHEHKPCTSKENWTGARLYNTDVEKVE